MYQSQILPNTNPNKIGFCNYSRFFFFFFAQETKFLEDEGTCHYDILSQTLVISVFYLVSMFRVDSKLRNKSIYQNKHYRGSF